MAMKYSVIFRERIEPESAQIKESTEKLNSKFTLNHLTITQSASAALAILGNRKTSSTSMGSLSSLDKVVGLPSVGGGGMAITSAQVAATTTPTTSKMISEEVPCSQGLGVTAADIGKSVPLGKNSNVQENSKVVLANSNSKRSEGEENIPKSLSSNSASPEESEKSNSRSNDRGEIQETKKTTGLGENCNSNVNKLVSVPSTHKDGKDKDLEEEEGNKTLGSIPQQFEKLKKALVAGPECITSDLTQTGDKDSENNCTEKGVEVSRSVAGELSVASPAAGEVDDFECRLCKKVLSSDDELNEHFSSEHLRVGNIGIFEPESPFPNPPTIFANDEEEEVDIRSLRPLQIAQISPPMQIQYPEMADNSRPGLGGPLNAMRRQSNENIGPMLPSPPAYNREEILWRNQINASGGFVNRNPGVGGMTRVPFPMHHSNTVDRSMAPPGHSQGQRISPPSVIGGMQHRPPGYPSNQALPRQALIQQAARPQLHPLGRGPGGPPPHMMQPMQSLRRVSPPIQSFPMSLHSALTNAGAAPSYTQAAPQRHSMSQSIQRPPPTLRHILPPQQSNNNNNNQYQMQQVSQQQVNPNLRQFQPSLRGPGNSQLAQTIGMNQQILNQMNVQRELNNQFQHRNQPQIQRPQQTHPQRLNSQHQLQYNRPAPLSQKRPLAIGAVEISEIRSNKEPRLENQVPRSIPPAEIRLTTNPITLTSTKTATASVTAAIGSVGNPGVSSVRLGNSITLSVCPSSNNSPGNQASPSLSPKVQEVTRQSPASGSPALAVHHSAQPSSVLAVRGVTVTRASPPVSSLSPISNPSPSNSPLTLQGQPQPMQQNSVIHRGPGSISPAEARQDRNFSPPFITAVHGSVAIHGQQLQHNFAVPRPPGPLQRLSQNISPFLNSSAERPDRPPTVDLTDDDVQAHANQRAQGPNQHMRQGLPQNMNRGLVGVGRPYRCDICGVISPSIQALEMHKQSSHNLRMNPSSMQSASATGPQNQRFTGLQQQQQLNTLRTVTAAISRPSGVHPVGNSPALRAPATMSILRSQQPAPQIRSQSPNRPPLPNAGGNNNQEKYLYIPLLDLSRIDVNKMRKLEEIGISCVVPLQGNNSMAQMGIPVLNLRDGYLNQHVPWDSVLPLGPVHQPTMMEQNNGNRVVNVNTSTNNNQSPTNANNNGGPGHARF